MRRLEQARELIVRRVLVAGSTRFTIEEVELYLRAPGHEDPFVHAHPAQTPSGQFYFHRAGASFRGGSFKGMDLTVGGDDAIGGILIRSVKTEAGVWISGPSLVVDALLAATSTARVADLDRALGDTTADDPRAVLHTEAAPRRATPTLATARVGLTLKRHVPGDRRPEFLMRRYRLLTDPRAIKKGRAHAVIALHQDGLDVDAIAERTGSPRAHVRHLLVEYERGRQLELASLRGASLTGRHLARLHGAWAARFAPEST